MSPTKYYMDRSEAKKPKRKEKKRKQTTTTTSNKKILIKCEIAKGRRK
jgi:hypothetical protein